MANDPTPELLAFVQCVADDFDSGAEPAGGYDKYGVPLDSRGDPYTVVDFSHGEDYAEFEAGIARNYWPRKARELLDQLD